MTAASVDGASTVTGGVTAETPVVFTAADNTAGLTVTSGNMALSEGYWDINSGKYRFCNDLFINGGNLTINGGHVGTKYWLVMNGTSSFTIEDGESVTAEDNGASNPNNGAMDLGRNANSDVTINIKGGTVTSHGSANNGDKWLALMLANGANSKGKLTVSNNGKYTSPNDISVGRGSSSSGELTVKDNGVFNAWTMYVAHGSNSKGTFNIQDNASVALQGLLQIGVGTGTDAKMYVTGGKVSVNDWLVIGIGEKQYNALLDISGGEVTHNGNNTHITIASRGGDSSKAEVKVHGTGKLSSNADIYIGERNIDATSRADATLTIDDKAVVDNSGAKVIFSATDSHEESVLTLNLNGGTLTTQQLRREKGSGKAVVNFGGGTLKATADATESWIIWHKSGFDLSGTLIADTESAIDTSGRNLNVNIPISGMGSLVKKGAGTLTLTGGYFGGLKISSEDENVGAVTTPGHQTLSSGDIFLASGINATMDEGQADTLSDKNFLIENGAVMTLTGITLDFSSSSEQALFGVSSLQINGSDITSGETDVTEYFNVDGAVVPYAVRYKASDKTFYAVTVPVELASGGEVELPSWYTTSMKLIISGDTTLVVPQGTTLGDVEFRDNGKIVYTLSAYTAGETASVATIGTVTYPGNETIANHIYISVDGVRMATVADTDGALTAAPREVEWIGTGTVDYSDVTQWQGGALTGFDIAVFRADATISSAHPVMKLTGGSTVTVAQALTIDALVIGTGGGSINTGSYGVTIANVKSVEGSLGFSGTGTVTISAAPAAPVGLALSGTVTATVPYTTKFSSLSFEAGNLLYVDVSGLSEETTLETPCPISLPQGYVDPNWFVAPKGKRAAFVYNYDDGIKLSSMRVPAEGESVVNVYLGGGNWRTTGNWSLDALPSSTDIALITLSNQTIEDNVADKISVSNIVVKTAYVKFKGGNAWPKIRAQKINGIDGARIALSCYGLGPVVGKNLSVNVDVETSTLDNPNQDCWIEGNDSSSRIAFYGNLYANESAFRVNGNVDFYGQVVCDYTSNDDNYFSNDVTFKTGSSLTVGADGTVTINTAIEFPGEVTVNGTLHEKAGCTFDSALKGSGTLNLSSGDSVVTHFKGDNSGFSGTINAAKNHVPYLYRIASGSENAVWNINTDMRYVGEESGTLKFGALNLSKGDWNWFYIKRELENLVIEVGARNVDMTWGEEYAFGGYNGTDADFGITDAKFRKVGTGTLNTKASNYPSIEAVGGTVSFEDNDGPSTSFVFGGGTFRFNSASYTDPMSKFDFVNSTGPIDIDTAGHTFTWTTAIGGSFSIVKRGTGTLALTGAHEYTGKTDVKGGVLILPYRDFGSQEVAVASGAELHLDMTGVAVIENIPVSFFTTTDAGAVERVKLLGSADYTFPLSRSEETGLVSYTPTAIDQSAPNTWIGGAEGDWNVAANWSRGVPQTTHNVVIGSTASIYSKIKADYTVKSLTVNGENFTWRAWDKDVNPKLLVESVAGTGKITLCRAGLENVNGVAMTVANDIDFGASDNGYDSWLAANGAKVEYTGTLTVLPTCGKFVIYGHDNMALSGSFVNNSTINADSNIQHATVECDIECNGKGKIANCTLKGAITVTANELEINNSTIDGKTTVTSTGQLYINTGNTLNGDVEVASGGVYGIDHECVLKGAMDNSGTVNIWNAANLKGAVNVNAGGKVSIKGNSYIGGNITGSGTVETSNENRNYYLSGNNSEFSGTFNHFANGRIYFKSADSGSAKAVWNIGGDADTTSLTSGTLKFGALNLSEQKLWFQNSNSALVMEVGALGQNMQFGGNYFFGTESWNSGTNPENVTLKVVGGKLTNASYGIRKMVVSGGEMVLATPTHTDGGWESYKNDHAGYQIDSLVVKKGAVLSGTTDQTVTNVKFEDGSYYRLTRTSDADNNYTVNSLTATSVEFGKNVYLYLSDADRVKAEGGTVLSGSVVTGSPMTTVLNEAKTDIAACNGEEWYWTASKTDSSVNLVAAQVAETSVNALETDEATAETSVTIRDADLAAWLTAKSATESVNAPNGNGVTGIMAYMTGAESYSEAQKPVLGATVADGKATLTFDDSKFRNVAGLKLKYYLESSDNADFPDGEVVKGTPGDNPSVQLDISNAKTYNRLCAEVLSAE